jgi:hypothetical protein
MGVMGLMTVVRVLPPDLYEKVVSEQGDVQAGASVPGAVAGKSMKGTSTSTEPRASTNNPPCGRGDGCQGRSSKGA